MARYKDEQCRICRREGQKLFLKGSRCYSDKCSITRRNYAPGQNGQKKSKISTPLIQFLVLNFGCCYIINLQQHHFTPQKIQ